MTLSFLNPTAEAEYLHKCTFTGTLAANENRQRCQFYFVESDIGPKFLICNEAIPILFLAKQNDLFSALIGKGKNLI